jgi:S1-C subfamily serine protease
LKKAGIKEGFIITQVNKTPVQTVDELRELLKSARGGIFIEGIEKNGEEAYYVFRIES